MDIDKNKYLRKEPILISVIIPVYKAEKYIHRCIESILGQTYKNLEIILVDDGSPDKCGEICDKYSKVDERIKVIHQENAGVSRARNIGLMSCTGTFVMFVDSDDYISGDFIEILYSQICDADYISSGFTRCDSEGRIEYICSPKEEIELTGKDALYKHYAGVSAQMRINCIYVWGKLYRKEIWEDLKFQDGLLFEDIYIMPYLLLKCKKIKFVSDAGYYYREEPNSITNRLNPEHRKKAFLDSFTIWEEHISFYKEEQMTELVTRIECLKIEKIISQSISGTIPEGMTDFVNRVLKASVRKVLKEFIPLRQKLRYVAFWLFGKDVYMMLRKIT